MKTLIYTAIFNNYDTLQNVSKIQRKDVSFVCVSNCISEKEAKTKGWLLNLYEHPLTGTELNRFFKMNTESLPDHDINVYLDGNKWITDIDLLFYYCKRLYDSDKQILLSSHWGRNTVFGECFEVIRLNKAPKKETFATYKQYRDAGFKDNVGLYCASVQIRKNSKENEEFLYTWYEEFKKYPYRDQISLPFTIYKCSYKDKIFNITCNELLAFVENRGHLKC